MKKSICKYCHKEYKYYPSNGEVGKFCSLKCYQISRPHKIVKKCVVCGKEFLCYRIDKRKYCSRVCHDNNGRIEIECPFCKRVMKVSKYRVSVRKHCFCNRKCMVSWMKKHPLHTVHHSIKTKRKIKDAIKKWQNTKDYQLFIDRQVKRGKLNTNVFKKGHGTTPEIRNKIREARVKQIFPLKQSSIEILLGEALKKVNIEFETNIPLEGICIPDLFIKPNIVIFCDGDYWHNLPGYKSRDSRINSKLINKGYKVLRLWEHEIKGDIDVCLNRIYKLL